MNWQTCAVCPVHVHVRRRCNAFISTESYNKPTLTQVPAIDCCVCNIYPSQLLETLCFTAVQVYNVQSAAAHIVPRCSMTFSDAETLLFQSAERALIDVKSIHVATNEMEEILHLLTERDIEHTNNPPTLLCSFLRPPIFSISQTYTLRSNSVNISPSVSASLSVCVIMCTSTKPSCIQTDPSIYSQPARLSTCLLVNASLSYLSLSTSLAKPAKKLNTVYVLLRNYPFCKDVITLSSHYKQIWGLWTFEKTLNLCSNCSRNYKFHQLNIKLQAQAQQTFAKKPLLILRGWFYWRDANFV